MARPEQPDAWIKPLNPPAKTKAWVECFHGDGCLGSQVSGTKAVRAAARWKTLKGQKNERALRSLLNSNQSTMQWTA
ncbi:hypothetical protein [Aphanothece microscopica]|uniref:hypothetical protein n=1 Tax=Aphanothece microscopica TaxID=1049561 RepID=UPI003CE4B241